MRKSASLTKRMAPTLDRAPGFTAPPTFLVASTADDMTTPEVHVDPYAKALGKHGIDFEYLRQDFGPHGFDIHEGKGGWVEACVAWLKDRGFGSPQ